MIKTVYFSFCLQKPKLFLFAGQGTQRKGMLSDLLKIPSARKQIDSLSTALGYNFEEISTVDAWGMIDKTHVTQPLLVLSQVLRFRYLGYGELGSEDYLIGHSVGEYSALCVAGSIGLEECLRLVRKRGELMQAHTREPSGMLIVRFSDRDKPKVDAVITQNSLYLACYNTANNIIVAGPLSRLQQARTQLRDMKVSCLFLPVSAAFHCRMLTGMVESYKAVLGSVDFKKPKACILRNLDGRPYRQAQDIRFGLLEHITHPVQFWQSVAKVDVSVECIEIGHNQTMKKFVEEIRAKMRL